MPKLDTIEGLPTNQQVLEELLAFKQSELTKLQQAVLAEQANLSRTKADIEAARVQGKYERDIEQDQFKQSLLNQAQVLQSERKSLERLDLELNARAKDVEVLEAKAAPIQQAMQKLANERLAIEQQRVRNEELRAENDRLHNTTSAAYQEVATLKATLVAQQTRVQTRATEQDALQTQLDLQAKDVALQVENLSALKETLDPKLTEVMKLQTQAEADRHQATLLHDATLKQQTELDQQKSSLAILSSQLEAKAAALTDYDASLKRTESELRIKVQQAKVEGIEVAVPSQPSSVTPSAVVPELPSA